MSKSKIFIGIAVLSVIGIIAVGLAAGAYFLTGGFKEFPWTKDEYEIVICDGSVCKKNLTDKTTEMIMNKEDFDIVEFTEVNSSANQEHICVLAQAMIPMWVYYADIDGNNVEKVGLAENCVWSNNSKKFAYTNHTTDVSPHNVFMYTIATDKKVNLTKDVNSLELMRIYEKPVWSDDDKFINSQFTQYDRAWNETSGESRINAETGEVTDL